MHTPVLQKEVIDFLDPKPNENFVDATIGGGGHTFEILKRTAPAGKILGIDLDESAIESLRINALGEEINERLILTQGNFADLEKIVAENNFWPINGILADLGISSTELEASGRGFSFLKDEPLDMRFSKKTLVSAKEIINQWPEEEIAKIIRQYGEEKFSRQIAKKIIERRKIKPIITSRQLTEIIKEATPFWYHNRKIHPATKTFQALRIAVNDELVNLNIFLPSALNVLTPGGRLVIISFHSLEDRIVKNFFREKKNQRLIKVLTKKPVKPSSEEIFKNPRSRSAKLRAAVKLLVKK